MRANDPLEPAMRAISRPLRGTCLLAALRLDGACGTSPSAPVDRLRRSRSTFDEEHPVRGAVAVWGSFRQDLLI